MAILNDGLIEIYHQTIKGGMVLIGNSLQVVGDDNDLNREFIDIDGNYTLDWRTNGSSVYLEIPNNAKVTYAILEWFTTISNDINTLDNTLQYKAVRFKTPIEEVELSNSNEAQSKLDNTNVYSSKWVEVTSYIKNSKSGYYSLSSVPSVNPLSYLDNNNKSGWTLTVVYEDLNLPSREICIYFGMKAFNPLEENKTITLSNITVPNTIINAHLTMAFIGGTPNKFIGMSLYDDISKINSENMIYKLGNNLSAVNSYFDIKPILPYDNLFSGIIMNTNVESDDYGKIDYRGTLGNKNNSPYNIKNSKNYKGNRAQLDILSFDISDKIVPNQNKIVLVGEQKKDSNFIFGLICGVQIDKTEKILEKPSDGGPLLVLNKFSNKNLISLNDKIDITLTILNKGDNIATNVILFINSLPGAKFLSNSLYLNGKNIFLNELPTDGLKLGGIYSNSAIIVEYSIFFFEEPIINPEYPTADIKYTYIDKFNIEKSNIIKAKSNEIVVFKEPIEDITLYTNKTNVLSKDKIIYTLILENRGKVVAKNVNVQNLIPSGLNFIDDTLKINDIQSNFDSDYNIMFPVLYPNSKTIIEFQVRAN